MNTTRILRTVSIVLLSISAAAACGFVWLKIQGGSVMSVQSGSMEPTLSKGDLLVVTRSPDYKIGDVVTFMSPDKKSTITHRLASVNESSMGTTFVTKGDANPLNDTPISKGSVLGEVTLSVPFLGYIADVMRTPLGLLILIYLPALGIMIQEVKKLATHLGPTVRYSLFKKQSQSPKYFVLLGLLVIPGLFGARSLAAMQSTATLTGNTISTSPLPPPPPSGGSTCTTNTSVNINSSTNQSSSSGAVTNTNNTSTGQSSSGSASNSSSTNIAVSVQGC